MSTIHGFSLIWLAIDIKSHNDNPEDLIRAVRNWFVETVDLKRAAPASVIYGYFNDFIFDFDVKRKSEGFDAAVIFEMPYVRISGVYP